MTTDSSFTETRAALDFWCPDPEEEAMVAATVRGHQPEAFAICALDQDEDGATTGSRVLAWGLASTEGAEVVGSTGGMRGSFGSVDSAMYLFAMHAAVCAVPLPSR